jgi:hypothetical protein
LIYASTTGIPWVNCFQFVLSLLALSSSILVFLLNALPPYNGLSEGGVEDTPFRLYILKIAFLSEQT